MKDVSIGVADFALPAPRAGSIESLSGFGRAQELGREIHRAVQAKRSREVPDYRAEVWTEHAFEAGGYRFKVGGKMDGFTPGEPPAIEEIKTSFNAYELLRRLRGAEDEHPYCLQLRTYGYLHRLKTGQTPRLSLHLVSTRDGGALDLELRLEPARYEAWLARRLEELVEEARLAERRAARRRRAARELRFPFEAPRPGQTELISAVEEGMREGRPMLLQAPTGLGKTVGVLYPAAREALSRGQGVVYVTPKNSQHAVAEDAVARLHESLPAGSSLRSLSVTAKSKLCLKDEPVCNPAYCEFARDHYKKAAEKRLVERLSKKRRLTHRTFRKLALEHEVCPYELQLDAARDADVVICDYNYVFSPRSALGRLSAVGLDQSGAPNLVIDEAHNLPARALDYYSPALSAAALEALREGLEGLDGRFRRASLRLLDRSIEVVKSCGPEEAQGPCRIEPPAAAFLSQEAKLRALLSAYLASDAEIRPKDPVLRLCFYWSEFAAALEFVSLGREEFFTTFHPSPAAVKITCCDASRMLESRYEEYRHVIGFSATLKPFEYYRRLAGLRAGALKTEEFHSPFPRENRKLLVIPQISSRWSERERSYPRAAEAIARIAALRKGNYFAFFPSFEFLEKVLGRFTPPPGFTVLRQTPRMSRDAVAEVFERLSRKDGAHLVFAVQGGALAEGVDYPGEMAVGAFIVGPPLPKFELEREGMREYYERRYAAGFDYAYAFPAMAKAVQAAGRVIRSETDRGLIVLMDGRFLEPAFAQGMPADWFDESPRELVSGKILDEVARFWAGAQRESSPSQA